MEDGESTRSCSRCGSAFSLTAPRRNSGLVYREPPVVPELVPLGEPVPHVGLELGALAAALDVTLGSRWTINPITKATNRSGLSSPSSFWP